MTIFQSDKIRLVYHGFCTVHVPRGHIIQINLVSLLEKPCVSILDVCHECWLALKLCFDFLQSYLIISSVCRSVRYGIYDIQRIRFHIPVSVLVYLANVLVCSRLNYCNLVLISISKATSIKPQWVQNASLSRAITDLWKYEDVSLVQNRMHWLYLEKRTISKIGHKWDLSTWNISDSDYAEEEDLPFLLLAPNSGTLSWKYLLCRVCVGLRSQLKPHLFHHSVGCCWVFSDSVLGFWPKSPWNFACTMILLNCKVPQLRPWVLSQSEAAVHRCYGQLHSKFICCILTVFACLKDVSRSLGKVGITVH